MHRYLSPIAGLLLLCTSCWAQLTPVNQAVTLKSQGAPGLPLASQWVLAHEAGGDLKLADQHAVTRQLGNEIVKDAATSANAKAPPSYQDAAISLVNGLADETQQYEVDRGQLEADKAHNKFIGTTAAGVLTVLTVAETFGTSAAGAAAVEGVVTWALDAKIEQRQKVLDDTYVNKITDAFSVYLDNLSKQDPTLYSSVANSLGSDTPEDALSSLKSAGYFDQAFLNDFSPQARTVIETQAVPLLADALEQQKNWTAAQLQSAATAIGQNTAKIDAVANELVKTQTDTQDALNSVADAQEDAKTAISDLQGLTSQNSADIETVQRLMLGKLSASEQLDALTHGFGRDLPADKRQELINNLTKQAAVDQFQQDATKVFKAADGLATALGALHILGPSDVANLQANINLADSAINVAADFLTGQPWAAVAAIGGLFPGGGSNAAAIEQAHFEAIMGRLDVVIQNEKAISDAVQDLSVQVARSTDLLMAKLADLETKIDFTNVVLLDAITDSGKNACLTFQSDAQDAYHLMDNGSFRSYNERVAHFNNEQQLAGDYFNRCVEFLTNTYQLEHPNAEVPVILWTRSLNAASSVDDYQSEHYAPMLQLTYALLKMVDGNGNLKDCANTLLLVLTRPPLHFADLDPAKVDCPDGTSSKPAAGYKNASGKLVSPGAMNGSSGAFTRPIAFSTAHLVGDLLAFYAPYFDFFKDAQRTMFTQEELASRQPPQAPRITQGGQWFDGFLDVMNVEVAQEALYAGPYLVVAASEELAQRTFGEDTSAEAPDSFAAWRVKWQAVENESDAQKRSTALKQVAADWGNANDGAKLYDTPGAGNSQFCNTTVSDLAPVLYQVLTCVMNQSDPFAQNVVLYLVLNALNKARQSQAAYTAAYNGPQILMAQVLPGLPIVWGSDTADKGWFLKLRHHTGERWFLPLPDPSAVNQGFVHYSLTMQYVLQYRDTVAARLAIYKVHLRPDLKDTADGRKALARVALYGKDLTMTQVYSPRGVR